MYKEFEIICQSGEVFGSISEEDVIEAEKRLGLTFPKEYRDFLLKYGALLGDGFEIYGLPIINNGDEPSLWQNVVIVAEEMRAYRQIGTEDKNMIPISSDGMGTNYFIRANISSIEVWMINSETRKIIASNLFELVEFLRKN